MRSVCQGYLLILFVRTAIACHDRPACTSSCLSMLKQLDGAKQTWALEHGKSTNNVPTDSDLYGTDKYIRDQLLCPGGGTYTIGRVGEDPRCSIPMHSLKVGHVYVVDESKVPLNGALVVVCGASGSSTSAQTDQRVQALCYFLMSELPSAFNPAKIGR